MVKQICGTNLRKISAFPKITLVKTIKESWSFQLLTKTPLPPLPHQPQRFLYNRICYKTCPIHTLSHTWFFLHGLVCNTQYSTYLNFWGNFSKKLIFIFNSRPKWRRGSKTLPKKLSKLCILLQIDPLYIIEHCCPKLPQN